MYCRFMMYVFNYSYYKKKRDKKDVYLCENVEKVQITFLIDSFEFYFLARALV